jgi:hypothetical protein
MGASSGQKKYLHVAVYRSGAEIGICSRPLASRRGVTAGRGFFCDIKSVIWPLWDELEILVKTPDGLVLNPRISWDGVIQNGSQTFVLSSLKPTKNIFSITATTFASLRFEDLSVAIRIGPKGFSTQTPKSKIAGYMASPLTFIAETSQEWTSLGIGVIASGIIASLAFSTLKTRANDSYTGIFDLTSENLLPFISQRYLAESPHVLQDGLDRFDLIRSVWTYYSDLALVIGFGLPPKKTSPLFPTTIDHYGKMADEQRTALGIAAARQQSQMESGSTKGGGLLTVPMVRGESLDGRIERVFDKIGIVLASSTELADRRVVVGGEFLNSIGYTFENRDVGSKTADNFKKLSESFMGVESDDKEQFIQAKSAGARAALVQVDLFGKDRLKFGHTNCCAQVVGAPLSSEGLVWLAPDFTMSGNGELASLKASVWGAPVKEVPQIREPLAGHIKPSEVDRIVHAGRYQLRLCYEIALRRNQTATGSMEWRWLIDSRGVIANIGLLKNSIKDEELVRCVRDRIATWKFPKPTGGSVEVRYPFEFSRDKG